MKSRRRLKSRNPQLRPHEPGAREFEFGAPFPGRVRPEAEWASTSYRDGGLGEISFEAVFGRKAPLVLELGCGNGRYLIGSAMARPNRDHFGLDEVQRVIDFAVMRANRRGVRNARFAVGDAKAFLEQRTGAGSAAEIHVYHPQPCYDEACRARRLVCPGFFLAAWRALSVKGLLVLQTDNVHYWRYMLETAPALFEISVHEGPWPDSPRGRTRREIVARSKGFEIYRMTALKRDGLDPLEAERLAAGLPAPDFDANRGKRRKKDLYENKARGDLPASS